MTTLLPYGKVLYRAEVIPIQSNQLYSFSDKFEGALTYLTLKVPMKNNVGTISIYMVNKPITVTKSIGVYAYRKEQIGNQKNLDRFQIYYSDYIYTVNSNDVTKIGSSIINMTTLYNFIPNITTIK